MEMNNLEANDVRLYSKSPEEDPEKSSIAARAPEVEHKIKDLPALVIFVAMLTGLFFLSGHAVKHGNPYRYYKGYDSWGNVCGYKNTRIRNVALSGIDHSKRPYAFHMGLTDHKNVQNPVRYLRMKQKPAVICVSECPTNITSCQMLLTKNGYDNEIAEDVLNDHICVASAGVILEHKPVLSRCVPLQLIEVVYHAKNFILPNVTSEESDNATNGGASSFTEISRNVFVSVQLHWRKVIYLSLSSVLLCFLMSLLFLFFTRALLGVVTILGIGGSTVLTGYMWYHWYVVKYHRSVDGEGEMILSKEDATKVVTDFVSRNSPNISSRAAEVDQKNFTVFIYKTTSHVRQLGVRLPADADTVLIWAVVSTVFCFVIIILLVWFRKSMKIVVQLFDAASHAIFNVPCILVQPLVTLFFVVVLFIHFFFISAHIFTIDMPVVDERQFVSFVLDNETSHWGLFSGHLLGCYWCWEFMLACESIIIARALADWFYRRQTTTCCHGSRFIACPTLIPTLYVIRYQFGTAAFGSLLLASLKSIRVAIKYFRGKAREKSPRLNRCCELFDCACCFWLEKALRFVNSGAYICAGISGSSFVESGKRAITLIIQNASTAFVLHCIEAIFLFIAKIAVAQVAALISFHYFRNNLGLEATKSDYLFLVFIVGVTSYVIARSFFSAYGQTLDTLFLCYADDKSRHNGEALFISGNLKDSFDTAHTRLQTRPIHPSSGKLNGNLDTAHTRLQTQSIYPSAWSNYREQEDSELDQYYCLCSPMGQDAQDLMTREQSETILLMKNTVSTVSRRN